MCAGAGKTQEAAEWQGDRPAYRRGRAGIRPCSRVRMARCTDALGVRVDTRPLRPSSVPQHNEAGVHAPPTSGARPPRLTSTVAVASSCAWRLRTLVAAACVLVYALVHPRLVVIGPDCAAVRDAARAAQDLADAPRSVADGLLTVARNCVVGAGRDGRFAPATMTSEPNRSGVRPRSSTVCWHRTRCSQHAAACPRPSPVPSADPSCAARSPSCHTRRRARARAR